MVYMYMYVHVCMHACMTSPIPLDVLQWGNTPLHDAAGRGHLDVVKALVAKGADFNAKNDVG